LNNEGVYRGELDEISSLPCGIGVFEKMESVLLVGEFRNGLLELVSGVRHDYQRQVTEEGFWNGGNLHGRGIRVSALERYEGDWWFGKKHGHGVWNCKNGDRIEGQFAYDCPSGSVLR